MNARLFKQLINNNSKDEKKLNKEAISKEKNLTSTRRKVISNYVDGKLDKKIKKENTHVPNHLSSFNLKTNPNQNKKIILNAKKIFNKDLNWKKKIYDKKHSISKKKINNIINPNSNSKSIITNSKHEKNSSMNSVKSESEKKLKFEEFYNNRLSYELILFSGNDNIQRPSDNSNNSKNIRNFSPHMDKEVSSTNYKNFSINKNNNKNNKKIKNKKKIKVNLNTNRKVKKNIKKEPSYAMSNANTNSNTNSKSRGNYFNDNINSKTSKFINNFNKDIKEILCMKESISLLKKQLKIDNNNNYNNNIYNLENNNKIKTVKNENKNKTSNNQLKQKKNNINTRNENRNNNLQQSKTLPKSHTSKINHIKLDNIKNNKKIFIRQHKSKSNIFNVLRTSKNKNSICNPKRFINTNSHTCKNFFSQKKGNNINIKKVPKRNKSKPNTTKKAEKIIPSQKSCKEVNNLNN